MSAEGIGNDFEQWWAVILPQLDANITRQYEAALAKGIAKVSREHSVKAKAVAIQDLKNITALAFQAGGQSAFAWLATSSDTEAEVVYLEIGLARERVDGMPPHVGPKPPSDKSAPN